MTIHYCVQIADPLEEKDSVLIQDLIHSVFSHIHQIYDNWNPDSEISNLNQLPAYQKCPLSQELTSFLRCVDKIVRQTEGRFDPTVEPLQRLWKKCLNEGHLPPAGELATLSSAVGWDKVHVENGLFWKEHPLTALDLGGIAKGYAVDLLVETLLASGYKNLYVEWGGEVRTAGQHCEKRAWKIGIRGLKAIDLKDLSIATSGSYIQNWTIEGEVYTHIVDPRTKKPLHNSLISSVSVIAPTCYEADAFATALMLFPSKEEALEWAKERELHVYIW